MKNVLEIISCPTCFKISGCDIKKCKRECLRACKYDSIKFENNKAEIDISKCRSCTLCSLVCPIKAIDKPLLKEKSSSLLLCSSCQKTYRKINNVYLLLPEMGQKEISKLKTGSKESEKTKDLIDWKFISYQYFIRFNKFIDYVNPIIKNDLVLDIGCASGALSYNFKNYIGLDNSLKLVSFASRKIDKMILLADARYIPLRNKSIPFFISRNLLEHTKEEMKIIHELRRVTQKGGFFELPCSDQISWLLDPINLLLIRIGKKHLNAYTYGYGHINMLSFNEWKKRVINGGFRVEEIKNLGNGVIFNLISFIESLFLSYGDNDSIPAKFVPQKLYGIISKIYRVIEKIDPRIAKSWTKLFYVKV